VANLSNLSSDLRLDLQGLEVPDGLGEVARVRKAGFIRLDGMMEVRFEWHGLQHTVVVPADASAAAVGQAIREFIGRVALDFAISELVGMEVEA